MYGRLLYVHVYEYELLKYMYNGIGAYAYISEHFIRA